jgi:hypothetical protein
MKLLIVPIILALSFVASGQTPAMIERELLGYSDAVDKSGSYSGNYDEDKNSKANGAIHLTLERAGKRLDVLRYAFPKLKERMYVATSSDGNLRIYSWDLETGGTMHDFACIFQFRGNDGNVQTWSEGGDDETAGGYYTQIFQVSTKDGPIYLANSNFIAQGNLHGQSIEGMRITGNNLNVKAKVIRTASGLTNTIDFVYDPSSLGRRSERLISFDSTKQQFAFPIVVEDKTFETGRVTNRSITYRFDGHYFVKVG